MNTKLVLLVVVICMLSVLSVEAQESPLLGYGDTYEGQIYRMVDLVGTNEGCDFLRFNGTEGDQISFSVEVMTPELVPSVYFEDISAGTGRYLTDLSYAFTLENTGGYRIVVCVPDTGVVESGEYRLTLLGGAESNPNCPDLPIRLVVGGRGQSIRDGMGATNARPEPGVGEPIFQIQEGEGFFVLRGPICGIARDGDRMRYFQIENDLGQQAWVPEANDERYFMEPLLIPITPIIQVVDSPVSSSSSSELIAFVGLDNRLYTINSDGTGLTAISDDIVDLSALAPFRRVDERNFDLDIIMAGMIGETMVPENIGYFDLSPDGSQIVFDERIGERSNIGISLFVANINGTGERLLYGRPGFSALRPLWSPDGRSIVFYLVPDSAWPAYNAGSLFVIHLDGTGLKELTGNELWYPISWSPDSTRVLALGLDKALAVFPIDGSSRVNLGSAIYAVWVTIAQSQPTEVTLQTYTEPRDYPWYIPVFEFLLDSERISAGASLIFSVYTFQGSILEETVVEVVCISQDAAEVADLESNEFVSAGCVVVDVVEGLVLFTIPNPLLVFAYISANHGTFLDPIGEAAAEFTWSMPLTRAFLSIAEWLEEHIE